MPSFTPGTLIATPRGERKVQDLSIGDRVVTRDNGIQEIRWVGQRRLTREELAKAEHLNPVLIPKGALSDGLPERDMLVSPNQRLLVTSDQTALYFEEREVMAAAKRLTGVDGVEQVDLPEVTYVFLMFDQHEVVLSNGTWSESFHPGDRSQTGAGNAQRNEIYELFPKLKARMAAAVARAAQPEPKRSLLRLLS